MSDSSASIDANAVPDLQGTWYLAILREIHTRMAPSRYLEIGVREGDTLVLAQNSSIGIDPEFVFETPTETLLKENQNVHLYQQTSDDFFAQQNPKTIFGGRVDFAFLDGMHLCEFLLRDFMNTEKYCHRNSVIALHDCLPVEPEIALRERRPDLISEAHKTWWTGDVWKTALAIKRHRKDLCVFAIDAAPTGLVLITNLDPHSNILNKKYDQILDEMSGYDLSKIGIENFFTEMDVRSATDWVNSFRDAKFRLPNVYNFVLASAVRKGAR